MTPLFQLRELLLNTSIDVPSYSDCNTTLGLQQA